MLRLMEYNILDGGAGRVDPLAEVIRHVDADVVACIEAESEENFNLLAQRLGMEKFWAQGAEHHAVGVLTRLPIVRAANHSRTPMRRAMAEVHVKLSSGLELPIFALHLTSHLTLERENIRVEELQYVLAVTAGLRSAGTPHVLMGDFNATHPDQAIDPAILRETDRKRLAAQDGVVPRHAIEMALHAGYVDAYNLLHADQPGYTLSTREPSLRTDYVFLSPDLSAKLLACDVHHERLATYASDHFPLWAELNV